MKEIIKSFCILLALSGMFFSCSGHRVMEEHSLEIEESELEDLVNGREESERHLKRRLASGFQLPTQDLTATPLRSLIVRLRLSSSNERDRLNGNGCFLLT